MSYAYKFMFKNNLTFYKKCVTRGYIVQMKFFAGKKKHKKIIKKIVDRYKSYLYNKLHTVKQKTVNTNKLRTH